MKKPMFLVIPKKTKQIAIRIARKTNISYDVVLKVLCELTKEDLK